MHVTGPLAPSNDVVRGSMADHTTLGHLSEVDHPKCGPCHVDCSVSLVDSKSSEAASRLSDKEERHSRSSAAESTVELVSSFSGLPRPSSQAGVDIESQHRDGRPFLASCLQTLRTTG